ncbi:trichodiene oxygenase [Xylariaceae sp. FL0804]|nr:trichodiene oxygenase [Xylariaceae sp. FL0804]
MESATTGRLLCAAFIAYYGTLIYYRLFLHPLSRFPGPRLAAVSRWYEGYYDVILGGQYTRKISHLHRVYGPIIRISPHELHVADSTFSDTLYRMDGRWDKYRWTYDAFGAKKSTVFCSDHNAHKAYRRAIAPFFSKPNLLARQGILYKNVDKLCRRISLAGSALNLGAAISAFTRDNANEYVTGKKYNELDLEDFGVALSTASQGAGVFWRTTKHIRCFGPLIKAIPVSWAMKVADDGTMAFLRYLQQSEQDTRDTLAAANSSTLDEKGDSTMIHEIVNSDLQPADKSYDRVLDEVATVTAAGLETTANTLRLILYHVYSNHEILRRLRGEVVPVATENVSQRVTVRDLEKLPYLTAVLMEGLRLSPGIATRAARVTDHDLFYGDWRIPAGTPVGMTAWLIHTDEKLYAEPMRFNPDRWMSNKPSGTTFLPFSRGTRTCLGMHLAWAEMYLVLAALTLRFDFRIQDATASDFDLERDNFAVGTKAGCNLMAQVTPHEA